MFTQILTIRTDMTCIYAFDDLIEVKIISIEQSNIEVIQNWAKILSISNLNLAANISLKRATEITLNIERKLNNYQQKVPKLNFSPGFSNFFGSLLWRSVQYYYNF